MFLWQTADAALQVSDQVLEQLLKSGPMHFEKTLHLLFRGGTRVLPVFPASPRVLHIPHSDTGKPFDNGCQHTLARSECTPKNTLYQFRVDSLFGFLKGNGILS